MTENHTQPNVPTTFAEIPEELREHIEHREDFGLVVEQAYNSLPDRYVMSMAAAADSPFPYTDGDVTVLGPEVFQDPKAMVIQYRGENYVRQDEAASRGNDLLRTIFERQAYFQGLLGHNYNDMSDEELVGYLKDQILALTDEAHEALNEIGWKPWATSRHVNREEFAGELADILCFLVNLALGVGLTASEFFDLHAEKALRNIKRQESKYDGVSGKCPGCKRAIDDLRAKGLPVGTFGGVDYCSPECIEKVNPEMIRGTGIPFHNTQES